MSNPLHYYQDKLAAPGSSLYYSLLYLPASTREPLLLLRTLFDELHRIAFTVEDLQPAHLKLAWWQTELQQLEKGQPHHPLTQAMLRYLPTIDVAALQTVANTFYDDLSTPVYDTQAQLHDFYQQTAGLTEKLLLPFYGLPYTDAAEKCLSHLGIFIQRVTHLRDLRIALQHQRTYISGEQLIQHKVTLAQLTQWKMTDHIYALLQDQTHIARTHYQQAIDLLDKKWRKSFSSTLILAEIHAALLNEMEKSDFPILTQRISLTPLRKWWISWKNR